MAMQKRYSGEFLSRKGVCYRAEIMQEARSPFDVVGDLTFGSTPLKIEWGKKDKEEVICGSTATLVVESPGDRTYEDLYTIEVGRIRLDVYRDNILYWSGTLDPEFYEEPYEKLRRYDVTLTFSDFGILDRMKFDRREGMMTVCEILSYAMKRAELGHEFLNMRNTSTTTVSTSGEGANVFSLDLLQCRLDNFYDEDGEAKTLKEVVEGVLQPLAAKIIQREGKIYVYDLNGLYTKADHRAIEWDGDHQTMGVDKVANNVKVTFSPYGNAELLDGKVTYLGKYDLDKVNYGNTSKDDPINSEWGEYYSFYPDYSEDHRVNGEWDYDGVDFTIFLHPQRGKGLKSLGAGCKYFHIQPNIGNAGETSGVAWAFMVGHSSSSNAGNEWKCNTGVADALKVTPREVMTSNPVYVPQLDEATAKGLYLRLKQEMLISGYYNPFSNSDDGNDEDNGEQVKKCCHWIFMPVAVTLRDTSGNALYHYENKDVVLTDSPHLYQRLGKWVAGADPATDILSNSGVNCWLEYYDKENPSGDFLNGWVTNHHSIGIIKDSKKLFESFKKMGDGEYIPYPPCGGYIEVEILSGFSIYVRCYDKGHYDFTEKLNDKIYKEMRWCLYKAPVLEILRKGFKMEASDVDDVEYSGYINKAAKDDINIDTICGTTSEVSPMSRGVYFDVLTDEQVTALARAGHTDHPEKLLIGTLFSQYAERKTTLSGEAVIDAGLSAYTEQNQGDKLFMMMEDVQDIVSETTEALYCEFRPDEYGDIEEVKE